MIAFIPVKGTSVRCPNKNKVLLPYVVEKYREFLELVVITDSEDIANMCDTMGIKYYMECKEPPHDEFYAVYDCITRYNLDIKEFVICPVTQPFKSSETILELIKYDMNGIDIVTTYTEVANRSIFLLNEDGTFKHESYHRKGCMCKTEKMIDGCLYKLTKESIKRIALSKDSNHAIWGESKIAFIKNKCNLFLDVDTVSDMEVFKQITKKDYDKRR